MAAPPSIENNGNMDKTPQKGTASSSLEFRTSACSETKQIVWKIENLSILIEMAVAVADTKRLNLVTFDSICFNAGGDNGMMSKWTYSITYGGENFSNKARTDSIRIYRTLNEFKGNGEGGDKVYVNDSLTLKALEEDDGKPFRIFKGKVKGQKALAMEWAWDEIGTLEGLKTGKVVVDDTLTLYINFAIFGNKQQPLPLVTEEVVKKTARMKIMEKLVKGLGTLLDNGDCADFVIKVKVPKDSSNNKTNEEYESLNVHKAVLAAHSPVFKAMFEVPMKEKGTGEMIIPDLSPKSMKTVLKFIYSGDLNEDWAEAPEEVIQAADRYELPILKEFCDKSLCQTITTSNALDMLKLCKLYNLPHGLKFLNNFIKQNVTDISSLL